MRRLIGKIYYDTNKEEALFTMYDGFDLEADIIRADILTDISWQAENMKAKALSTISPIVALSCGYGED